MRGTFKENTFDSEKLGRFIGELNASGLEFTVEWKKRNKLSEMGDANMLALKKNNKMFFHQFGKEGAVVLHHLDEKDQNTLLKTVKKYQFYTQPDYALGILLSGVFLALYAAFILPSLYAASETVMLVVSILLLISYFGMGMLYIFSGEEKEQHSLTVPMILIIPGFILCAPSSLLNLPLMKAILCRSLYSKVSAINVTS